MMIYQTVTLLVNFNNNDVTTHFNEIQTKPGFPDVTICNINPYDAFQRFPMSYDEYVSKVMEIKKSVELNPLDPTTSSLNIVWTELSSKRGYIVNNPSFEGRSYSPLDTFVTDHFWYDWHWLRIGVKETPRTSQNSGIPSITAVTPYPLQTLPNSRAQRHLVHHNFPPEAREFFKFYVELAMVTGVRLIVHPHGTKPYMEDGINIAPGTETAIEVSQTNFVRLPEPFGNCTYDTYLELDGDTLYSRSVCQSMCRQLDYYIPSCHCLVAYEVTLMTWGTVLSAATYQCLMWMKWIRLTSWLIRFAMLSLGRPATLVTVVCHAQRRNTTSRWLRWHGRAWPVVCNSTKTTFETDRIYTETNSTFISRFWIPWTIWQLRRCWRNWEIRTWSETTSYRWTFVWKRKSWTRRERSRLQPGIRWWQMSLALSTSGWASQSFSSQNLSRFSAISCLLLFAKRESSLLQKLAWKQLKLEMDALAFQTLD